MKMKLLVVVILAMFAYATGKFTSDDEKLVETTFEAGPDGSLHLIVKRDAEKSSCVDKKPSCTKWMRKGYCDKKKYKAYMAKNCKKSCDTCEKNADKNKACLDKNKSCKKWGKLNYCNKAKYSKFMKAKCGKTCRICKEIATTESTTAEETTFSVTMPMQSSTKQEYTTTVNITSPLSTAYNQEESASTTWSSTVETTSITQQIITDANEPLCVDSDRIPCGFLAAYCERSEYARSNCPFSCGLCRSSSVVETTIQPTTESTTQQQVTDVTTPSIDLFSSHNTVSHVENVTESESTTFVPDTISSSTANNNPMTSPQSVAEANQENTNYTSTSYVTYYIKLNSTIAELTNPDLTTANTTVDRVTDSLEISTIEPLHTINFTATPNVVSQTTAITTEATLLAQVTDITEDKFSGAPTTISQVSTSYEEQTTSDMKQNVNTTAIVTITAEPTQSNNCYDNRICTRYSPEMCNSSVTFQRYCPVMCNMCDPTQEIITTTFSTTTVTTAPASCMDLSINCKDHLDRCTVSENVQNLCQKSCGLCISESENATENSCVDASESCLNLKQFCTSSKLGEKIREKCPRTCGVCENVVILTTPSFAISTNVTLPNNTPTVPTVTQSNDCTDDYAECVSLSVFCTTHAQVAASCRLTCGTCKQNSTSNVSPTTTSESTTISPATVTPTVVVEDEKCKDSFSRCTELRFKCRDPASVEYLRISCKKTCGFCTSLTTEDNSVVLKDWSQWSACSVSCGQGVQRRIKKCLNQNVKCTKDLPTEYRTCHRKICREEMNGCADRMNVESCQRYKKSQSCGMKVIGSLCMKTCEFCGTPESEQDQVTNAEAIEGVFTIWSEWGKCSASCGEGVMKRNRTCKSPYPQFENIICVGLPIEEKRCVSKSCVSHVTDPSKELCEDKNERCESWKNKGFCLETYTLYMRKNCAKSCGVCGVWDEWSEWSSCSVNCGGGSQERKRACKTVACKGLAEESRNCNKVPCGENQTPSPTKTVEECRDMTPSCKLINKAEKCKESIWTLMCKETCGLCPGSTDTSQSCQDKDPQCPAAAATGQCNLEQVKSLCPLACNLCSQTNTGARTLIKGCSDDRVTCPQLVQQLTCEISYVKESCKASCGLCQDECKDSSEKCPLLMQSGQCKNPTVMKGCPKSCGKCSGKSILGKEVCKDDSVQCPLVAQQGKCSVTEYAKYCRKSCNLCTAKAQGNTPCEDKSTQCAAVKIMGQCNNPTVAETCKWSCGLCNKAIGSVCRDETANCNVFVGLNQCSNPAISTVCAKSCNLCNSPAPEVQCKDQHDLCTTYAALNQCSDPKIKVACKKSCSQCRSLSSVKSCVDSSSNCRIYAGAKLCNNSAIRKSCPKSCQLCENNCQDSINTCPILVKSLKCENSLVLNSCKKSCGKCAQLAAKASCVDNYPQCSLIKSLGQCNNKVMSSMCLKTCDKCNLANDGPCEDAIGTCSTIASLGMCQRDNIKTMCRMSCKLCIPKEKTKEKSKENENTNNADTKVAFSTCKDLRTEGCQKFKERGYCDIDYFRDMCNKTCDVCSQLNPGKIKDDRRQEDKCKDVSDECNRHKGTKRCDKDENIMLLCPKTCNTCVRPNIADCRDSVDCSNLADQCNLKQVQDICKKTCLKCDVEGSDQALDQYEINNACRDEVYNCPKDKCGQSGVTEEYKNHIENMCPYTCNLCKTDDYGVWGTWSRCTVTCGGGTRERKKICKKGKKCVGSSPISIGVCGKDRCVTVKKFDGSRCVDNSNDCAKLVAEGYCNINGVHKESMKVKCAKSCKFCQPEWMSWSAWSACHNSHGKIAPCGEAYKKRTRECESPGDCKGISQEIKLCVQEMCSEYSAWSDWTECSVSCGGGDQTRQRTCDSVCVGPSNETRSCNDEDCSAWEQWSEWAECSVSCGGGSSTRIRNCMAVDKELCKEENGKETKQCGTDACAEWTLWSPWTECSKSCDGGTMSRKRECGGENCIGAAEETEECSVQICTSAGEWGEWTVFKECNAKCGKGVVNRRRDCLNGIPGSGGCAGSSEDSQECEANLCWGEWTWSPCNKDCGGGYRLGQRECLHPSKVCKGEEEIMEMCNTRACPSWSEWNIPMPCSKTCGGGVIVRKRKCIGHDSSVRNIAECGTLSDALTTTECNTESCYSGCIEKEIEIDEDANVLFASSPSPTGFGAAEGWINESPYAWCPYSSEKNHWIEIKFPEGVNMTGITISGYTPPMAAPTNATNPLMLDIYHKGISMSGNHVKIGQYLGPNAIQKTIKWDWNPVFNYSWKIELKENLPTDFPCLRFTFHECEQVSLGNNIVTENEGSGISD